MKEFQRLHDNPESLFIYSGKWPQNFHELDAMYELELSGMPFRTIPASVVKLPSLRVLVMHDSKQLVEIHNIANLKLLNTLVITKSKIREIPEGLRSLKLLSLELDGSLLTGQSEEWKVKMSSWNSLQRWSLKNSKIRGDQRLLSYSKY